MYYGFMPPDRMMNLGAWMLLFCFVFLLILVTLAITETIVQARSNKRCTATANGTYAGSEIVHIGHGRDRETIVYELAEFYANGRTFTARMRTARGIGMTTAEGIPIVVHYDPDNPSFCWGHTPGMENKPTTWRTVFRWCTIVTFVIGAVLIALSFPAFGLPLSELPSTVFAHI
ncbi:MAG: hypothetical protein J5804_05855 [Eggerthellaceae bacterium]|nr:hypothetical protein [Eggerthellaceae bacterium]